jgi:phosphonate transport system substrate-binding protein
MPVDTLRITSIQAPNADLFIASLAEYLSLQMEVPVEFVSAPPWQEREQLIDTGQAQLGWICSLPYVWKADRQPPLVELIAAPVMSALRYQDSPVYFSDVIVLKESAVRRFLDLRGGRWAYNEPHSHSGYNITRWRLAELEEYDGFFGQVIEAGSHQKALEMVIAGQVDASAIDSTVLETEVRDRPELLELLRVIEVLGPSPIPPFVASLSTPVELRNRLREMLLNMHLQPAGQAVLSAYYLSHFAAVVDADYDIIRDMERKAQAVDLEAHLVE